MENKNLPVFEQECRKWIKYFGLLDWSVVYDEDDLEDNWAQYSLSLVARNATLSVTSKVMTEKQIRKSAFHEVCHLLIAELAYYTSESVKETQSEEIQHVFIRRMENSVFEDDYQACMIKGE